jgi:predicted deacylase
VDRVLRPPRHIDGEPTPAVAPWFITRRENLASQHDGIVYPLVSAGAYVTAGQRIAYVTDFHGGHLQDITTPPAGAVLVIVTTPAINKGETVAVVLTASD